MQSEIRTEDVIALLHSVARGGPHVAVAVAEMLDAATHGRSLNINLHGLGVDPGVLKRVIEAAGNAGVSGGTRMNALHSASPRSM